MSVVTIGESLGLLVASRLGRLELVPSMDLHFGGAESNVAIGLARLGVPVTWMGRLGDDAIGRLVERQLRAEGVTPSITRDAEAPTALMLKERPAAGASAVSYYRAGSAGSRLAPADLDLEAIRGARVLHLTGISAALSDSSRAALDAAIDAARAAGAIVSFDVNHRSRLWGAEQAAPAYRAIAARADLVFAGDDEAELLTGEREPQAQAEAIAALGPTQVVIKRGADGAVGLADGERVERLAFAVDAIDSVGAGDAFVAGYLAELLAGAGLAERLRTGAACGAIACTAPGDWEAAPDRAAIARLLDGGDPVQR
ncbi:sugar kinase [Agrococcus baldri]|uniref:Ribokinase n=1 Tax=Agrococcus baldri TaxID=153730 RepID=A0AA87US35_9MICO|nr:sugar kinase [Agrococcus baldri]GEK80249.1 ribokinase [Agrococcus baldri]